MKNWKVLSFFFLLMIPAVTSWGAWVWSPEAGKFVNPESASQDTADEQYNQAMQLYKEKNLDDASKQLESLLKKFPASRVAAEAQYRLGLIQEEKGDYLKAFRAYKTILESYPQSERSSEVIEREYRIGNLFLSGKKGKLMGLEILPSLPRAVEIFKHIVDHAPYSEYGDKAQFRLGLAHKQAGQYQEAVEAFQTLIDQYPKSDLLADARFQLAETSFDRSASQFRDERALDEAQQEVDRFLKKYPNTEASEKAAKLRQQIDEKNAEKNYRIGVYYEKDDYLDSALIYYSDVVRRYPSTIWGKKAEDKLKSLKMPDTYLVQEQEKVKGEIKTLEEQLKAIADKKSFEYSQIDRKLERLRQQEKAIEKSKKETIQSHRRDIKRRERELKEKFKNLNKKKKLLAKNPSEDLKRALDRWTASLESEQAALNEEKMKHLGWQQTLGVKDQIFPLEFLPLLGESVPEVEKIRRIEAKKYYKISTEKKELLAQKELLFKQHAELLVSLGQLEGGVVTGSGRGNQVEEEELNFDKETTEKLELMRSEIKVLEDQLAQKRSTYERNYGEGWVAWMKRPANFVTVSAGKVAQPLSKMVNPFGPKKTPLKDLTLEQLLERQMHLKEKVAAQRSLVDTLGQAFDSELAMQERKRLLKTMESGQETKPEELRRSIKRLEKEIRARYEEIKDRHKHTNELLEQLDELLKRSEGAETKSGKLKKAAKPVTGFAYLVKSFFVGLPHNDVTLTQSAAKLSKDAAESPEALRLKAELEQESLLIEARYREISNRQKELDILKAKASLAGGLKFRSSMVVLPYSFIREAVDSANRLVPKKNREEMIVNLLDKETKEMEQLKVDAKEVDDLINQKSQGGAAASGGKSGDQPEKTSPEKAPEQKQPAPVDQKEKSTPDFEKDEAATEEGVLKSEIQSIEQKLDNRQEAYKAEIKRLKAEQKGDKPEAKNEQVRTEIVEDKKLDTVDQERKLTRELRDIEVKLRKLIEREMELDQEETKILTLRIERIKTMSKDTLSKALYEDLMVERERMEARVAQLALRRDFLNRELGRI